MKVAATVLLSTDKIDPLNQLYQVGIKVTRDDGKVWGWPGQASPSLDRAVASAVEAMLADTTVLEFVGMIHA